MDNPDTEYNDTDDAFVENAQDFLVISIAPGSGMVEFGSAQLVRRANAQQAAALHYNHAVVIPCEVFPKRKTA